MRAPRNVDYIVVVGLKSQKMSGVKSGCKDQCDRKKHTFSHDKSVYGRWDKFSSGTCS